MSNSFSQKVQSLAAIPEETKRKAMLLAVLAKELRGRGAREPVLVGGFAVELYTAGSYASRDLDIKGPFEEIRSLLLEAGFEQINRAFSHRQLGFYIDWLGEGPQSPYEDHERFLDVMVKKPDFYIKVIGFEDIILDRLMGAKYQGDKDGRLWALAMAKAATDSPGPGLDWAYMHGRAEQEDILDELAALRKEMNA